METAEDYANQLEAIARTILNKCSPDPNCYMAGNFLNRAALVLMNADSQGYFSTRPDIRERIALATATSKRGFEGAAFDALAAVRLLMAGVATGQPTRESDADYLSNLANIIRKSTDPQNAGPQWDAATEARNKFVYDERMKGTVYKNIIAGVKKNSDWEPLSEISSVKRASKAYAERHNLPLPPPRQSGRPTQKK